MNYQQFIEEIKDLLSVSLGNDLQLQVHTALKNNGKERIGITFHDPHFRFSPTIYLEEYYQLYQGGNSLEELAEKIVEIYHEVNFDHGWNVESIKNFETIQSKISYRLILADKNQALLQNVPHMMYLDFAIIFYILFEEDCTGTATITITNELLKLWGTDLQTLHCIAHQNTALLLPSTFKPMSVVIDELLNNDCKIILPEDEIMYVLSNSTRSYGAACMLYDNVLSDIGNQLGENYYILPSSIHELIIVPESNCPPVAELNHMVEEINETQVEIEEFLSDHVYYYSLENNEVSVMLS